MEDGEKVRGWGEKMIREGGFEIGEDLVSKGTGQDFSANWWINTEPEAS
jgi:hypothetical protein